MPKPRTPHEIIAHIRAVIADPRIDVTLIQTQDLGLLCDLAEHAMREGIAVSGSATDREIE